jgi:hypothetical protein
MSDTKTRAELIERLDVINEEIVRDIHHMPAVKFYALTTEALEITEQLGKIEKEIPFIF